MAERAQQPKGRRSRLTTRGCLGSGLLALCIVGVVAIIALPTLFRTLDEDWQFRLVRRFPFMAEWQFRPTPPFQSLPTLAVTEDDAYTLLLTPLASPTSIPAIPVSPTAIAALPSSTATLLPPTATATASATPTASATASPTASPTSTATATATLTRTMTPSSTPTATVPNATALRSVETSSVSSTASATPLPTDTSTATATATQTATHSMTPTVTPTSTATASPTASATPSAAAPSTNTHVPTVAPSSTPSSTPTSTPLPTLPVSYHASGYKWIPQTWNNCGPANLTQALEPFGWPGDQAKAAAYLKPNKEDKNVSPSEIVTYVSLISKETKVKGGIGALTRVGGDLALIKRLVSQQFSVILETGFSLPEEGWMGHYLTVIGYDDGKGVLYGLDTFLGDGPDSAGVPEKYDDLDRRWQQFNRVYIVIFPLERENEVLNILGDDTDLVYNVQHALDTARREAAANPNNQYAWFNMGSNYTLLGQYAQATVAFDRASRVGGGLPFRMLWYQFGPFEAYYHVGNYASVLALVNASLKTTTYVEETYYWRGMVAAAQGKSAQAIEDFNRVLKFNPNFALAAQMRDQVASGTFKPPITGG